MNVPEPTLVSPPTLLTTPLKVVEVLSAPVVRVGSMLSMTWPAPASEPIVALCPFRSKVAPKATMHGLGGTASSIPWAMVPAWTLVAPE